MIGTPTGLVDSLTVGGGRQVVPSGASRGGPAADWVLRQRFPVGRSPQVRRYVGLVSPAVLKHAEHASGPRGVIAQTIRSHYATLNQVEVITYDELLEAAERALAFDEKHLAEAAR